MLPQENFKIRYSEIASEAMFEPKMLYTRISPPVVSVDIEKRSNLAARNAATHVAHVVAPPQFACSSIAIEIEKPQFSRRYFECLKT